MAATFDGRLGLGTEARGINWPDKGIPKRELPWRCLAQPPGLAASGTSDAFSIGETGPREDV
jgi:hypothetical protein